MSKRYLLVIIFYSNPPVTEQKTFFVQTSFIHPKIVVFDKRYTNVNF